MHCTHAFIADNMLLDARGHLKLTDLGLCKKVGEVSPSDHPEAILEMMRQESQVGSHVSSGHYNTAHQVGSSGMHRAHGDPNAMSIDDPHAVGVAHEKPQNLATGKVKREVCRCILNWVRVEYVDLALTNSLSYHRWHILRLEPLIILLLKSWRRRMVHRVTPIRLLSIGGHWESSCMNA